MILFSHTLGQCCSLGQSRNIPALLWEVAGMQNNIKNISHRYPTISYAKINVTLTMRKKKFCAAHIKVKVSW
jgi:hypothetical protein